MALSNVFKNKVAKGIGTTLTDVYTSPAAKTATIVGLTVANVVTDNVFVSIKLFDTTLNDSVYLLKDAPLPIGSSIVPIGGDQKVVLEAGDKIQIQSDTAASIDVCLSVMELDGV